VSVDEAKKRRADKNKEYSDGKDGNKGDNPKSNNPKSRKTCFQFLNVGSCNAGDKCEFDHIRGSESDMVDHSAPKTPPGTIQYLTNMPKHSHLNGLKCKVIRHKGDFTQVWPLYPSVNEQIGNCLTTQGVLYSQLTSENPDGTSIEVGNLDTDKVDPYTMRAIFDPGAFHTVVPSEEYCVPGSVYELEEPVQMFGYRTDSSVEESWSHTHSSPYR